MKKNLHTSVILGCGNRLNVGMDTITLDASSLVQIPCMSIGVFKAGAGPLNHTLDGEVAPLSCQELLSRRHKPS
jgi:hypothetical protein